MKCNTPLSGRVSGVTTLNLKENVNALTADIQTLDARSNNLTVNLDGTQTWSSGTGGRFDTLELGGGKTFRLTGTYTGFNTYNIHGQATYDGDLDTNGGTLNFYLPSGIDDTDSLLTVNGDADITGSAITISKDGGVAGFNSLSTGEKSTSSPHPAA
ncbi:hypothetical protein AGMMS49960_01910 [Betaproteobacteria bacterium]|nr:hypothetical protein AGMMS49543_21210 [Betaproteobacteria bacterium]GHT98582.1 hypothetical protein AGMMS49960_01910 [Betaproteobacteria bacterium]GHU23477.1 hypothetical protein AGMMS50243_24950 [Betaproteobacteria bacterium]